MFELPERDSVGVRRHGSAQSSAPPDVVRVGETVRSIQARLVVATGGDRLKQEADRVAAQVGRSLSRLSDGQPGGAADVAAIAGRVQRSTSNNSAPTLGREGGEVDADTDRTIRGAAGRGRPLGTDLRRSMEESFGADFSGVRVHSDHTADALNSRVQAKAFTTGSDIFFSAGSYQPTSRSGQELLAHELTHVVQQGGARIARSFSIGGHIASVGQPAQKAIQRRLKWSKHTRSLSLGDDTTTSLGDLIRTFNSKEGKLSPSGKLDHLKQISRCIYQWYAAQDTKDLASLEGKEAKAVRALESDVDRHHEEAVEALIGGTSKTPRRGSKKTREKGEEEESESADPHVAMLRLIAAGTGPIRIVGPAPFQRRTRSMLVRIMDSPMGRKLLEAIVKTANGREKAVTIGDGDPPAELKGHLDDPAPTESKAIPQLTDVGSTPVSAEEKQKVAVDLTNMTKLKKPPKDGEGYGVVDEIGDFHRAVVEGKSGVAVGADPTVYYKFAPGAAGVYVAMVRKELGESPDNVSVKDRSLFTPDFITLAHELGHALNILAGAGTVTCRELFALFAGDVGTFESPGTDVGQWSNLEEMSTIQVVENEIRRQLGLELRGGHRTVVDEELNAELERKKEVTDWVGATCMDLWTGLRGSKMKKIAATISEDEVATLDALATKIGKLRDEQVQGLTNAQKRMRCAEYEKSWQSTFKTLGKMSKKVQTEAQTLLDGEYAELKEALGPLGSLKPRGIK